jgi:hypothetical protein
MARSRTELTEAAPVVDGQPELDPNNAWFGVSDSNIERITLSDGTRLDSHRTN